MIPVGCLSVMYLDKLFTSVGYEIKQSEYEIYVGLTRQIISIDKSKTK